MINKCIVKHSHLPTIKRFDMSSVVSLHVQVVTLYTYIHILCAQLITINYPRTSEKRADEGKNVFHVFRKERFT